MLSKNIWASALVTFVLLITSTQAAGPVVKVKPLLGKDGRINKPVLRDNLQDLKDRKYRSKPQPLSALFPLSSHMLREPKAGSKPSSQAPLYKILLQNANIA